MSEEDKKQESDKSSTPIERFDGRWPGYVPGGGVSVPEVDVRLLAKTYGEERVPVDGSEGKIL